jgi:uncharacterized protein
MAAEILVRGESELRSLPDRALIRVMVEADGPSQAEAYSRASELAAAVDAVFDKYADAVERRITAGVIVRPKTRWRKGETVRTGWAAGRTTALEITNFARLGALMAELPIAGASSVYGPEWEVDPSNPVHEQARRAAATDASRRASAYAEALGLRVGAMKWLSEPGLRHETGVGPVMAGPVAMASRAILQPEEEPMDVQPDEITIHAVVEACFEVLGDS